MSRKRSSGVETLPVVSSGELPRPPGAQVYGPARLERANLAAAQREALRRAQVLHLVLGVTVLALVVALAHQASRTRIIPYVVEVDRHGQALALGPAQEMSDPDRRLIMHALSLWIVRTRTVTADRDIQRRELLAAYDYTAGRAVGLLNDWFRRHPPFARSQTETVTVKLESLLALDETLLRWRLQWTEQLKSPSGAQVSEQLWQALISVEIDPPEAVEQVLANPLGLRVTDFDWQRLSGS